MNYVSSHFTCLTYVSLPSVEGDSTLHRRSLWLLAMDLSLRDESLRLTADSLQFLAKAMYDGVVLVSTSIL